MASILAKIFSDQEKDRNKTFSDQPDVRNCWLNANKSANKAEKTKKLTISVRNSLIEKWRILSHPNYVLQGEKVSKIVIMMIIQQIKSQKGKSNTFSSFAWRMILTSKYQEVENGWKLKLMLNQCDIGVKRMNLFWRSCLSSWNKHINNPLLHVDKIG